MLFDDGLDAVGTVGDVSDAVNARWYVTSSWSNRFLPHSNMLKYLASLTFAEGSIWSS